MNQAWKIVLTVIITAVIVGCGVYYWQNSKTSLPAPTESADEIASQRTYQNKKYGFEVKYPLSWFFVDCDSSYIGFSYSQSKLPICFTDQNQPHINIKVTEGSTVGIEKYIEDTQHSIDNYSKAMITINGNISATKFTGLVKSEEGPGPTGGLQTIQVLFSRNNNIYQVYYYGLDNKDYTQIFDQILSTFKFTNQNYIEVKELGFKIPVDSSMADEVTYKINDQAVSFSSKTLNALNKGCEGGIAIISKILGTPSNPVGTKEMFGGSASDYFKSRMANIKQFEGFFLLFSGPQSPCTDNRHDLESQVIQTILNGFRNISTM